MWGLGDILAALAAAPHSQPPLLSPWRPQIQIPWQPHSNSTGNATSSHSPEVGGCPGVLKPEFSSSVLHGHHPSNPAVVTTSSSGWRRRGHPAAPRWPDLVISDSSITVIPGLGEQVPPPQHSPASPGASSAASCPTWSPGSPFQRTLIFPGTGARQNRKSSSNKGCQGRALGFLQAPGRISALLG